MQIIPSSQPDTSIDALLSTKIRQLVDTPLSGSRQFRVLRKCQSKFDCLVFEMIFIKKSKSNRPFYSCVLSCLAFEWRWGWCWACFDVNLFAFLMLMTLFSCWLVGIYPRKVVRFLSKQGQHHPQFHSNARQLSTKLQNGSFEYLTGLYTCQTFCLTSM